VAQEDRFCGYETYMVISLSPLSARKQSRYDLSDDAVIERFRYRGRKQL
jgi:hypothetical protein